MTIGIDAIHYYVPNIYLPISTLAKERNIEPAKLQKGLGLLGMAVNDVHEDTATLAANAALRLFREHNIKPADVHRIYVGTESALDSAKPIATYVMHLLETQLGKGSMNHIDATDLTFACVGGIDALQNCTDFVRLNPNKKAIVIATDYAKYALKSTGEYTQGAGAVAMLISSQPRLLSLEQEIGVATESVFDFFKPRRQFTNEAVIHATQSESQVVEIHTDEPVFDGQYSNECYKNRLKEAYFGFKSKINCDGKLYEQWDIMAFHLPYAFQGKRMFTEIFALENGKDDLSAEHLKTLAKSPEYKTLVTEKMESSQRASSLIGNMYTASIFMALLSALEVAKESNVELEGKKVGLLAYGSGSKSKVWQGTIQKNWRSALKGVHLFSDLEKREAINYATYERLHKKQAMKPVGKIQQGFGLERIEQDEPNLIGARFYSYLGNL